MIIEDHGVEQIGQRDPVNVRQLLAVERQVVPGQDVTAQDSEDVVNIPAVRGEDAHGGHDPAVSQLVNTDMQLITYLDDVADRRPVQAALKHGVKCRRAHVYDQAELAQGSISCQYHFL